ncbi:hypothetical protein LMH87_002487 [Akanthomyces muscarius]|uniref:Uncharacterized protein n=1 Tax=Akanthomyces muscarius TaxID=2231603 RepID=A0A9W8UJA4_AKAMU|nr:hypothetical protein LMH87_002487 [Akanthomyces muscarius]KAJ4147997.1 hypothetical protein LMH87_002487 [Akanthomyces muscarius]
MAPALPDSIQCAVSTRTSRSDTANETFDNDSVARISRHRTSQNARIETSSNDAILRPKHEAYLGARHRLSLVLAYSRIAFDC